MTTHKSQQDDEQDILPEILTLEDGRRIAYHRLPGKSPGIVFFGGFASDMTGTKAMAIEILCRQTGQAFWRFDYTGHGASSGSFTEGTISSWTADALSVIDDLTEGPLVLIGSSMGGWIMLQAALARPERVSGLIGLASAPDFTEDLLHNSLNAKGRATLEENGQIALPSDYGEPYIITQALIEDGRDNLLLGGPIPITCPVRLLHGILDAEVPPETSLKLATCLETPDVTVTFIKHADHRLSDLASLSRIFLTIAEMLNPSPAPGQDADQEAG